MLLGMAAAKRRRLFVEEKRQGEVIAACPGRLDRGLRCNGPNQPRLGGPPQVRPTTAMPRRALSQRPKSRTSRPQPSGSGWLTSVAVSRELGANCTEYRKQRYRERGWFGNWR
jgi:hypothetical protein